MKGIYTFKSDELEKLEIVAGLLQQAGYNVAKIIEKKRQYTLKVRRNTIESSAEEQERIEQLAEHFLIEDVLIQFID